MEVGYNSPEPERDLKIQDTQLDVVTDTQPDVGDQAQDQDSPESSPRRDKGKGKAPEDKGNRKRRRKNKGKGKAQDADPAQDCIVRSMGDSQKESGLAELEAVFMLTATRMMGIRDILLEASAVLSKNLRDWIEQATDPVIAKVALRSPDDLGKIIDAIRAEGRLALKSIQTEKKEDDETPAPADSASVAEIDKTLVGETAAESSKEACTTTEEAQHKIPEEYRKVVMLFCAFITAKKDHVLAELDLVTAPMGRSELDLGYDMQSDFMDDEEYDPGLALALMLSMQDQHGPGGSSSMEGGPSGSSSCGSGLLPAVLEENDEISVSSGDVDGVVG